MNIDKFLASMALALIVMALMIVVIVIISGLVYLICTGQFYVLLGIILALLLFICLTYYFYKN